MACQACLLIFGRFLSAPRGLAGTDLAYASVLHARIDGTQVQQLLHQKIELPSRDCQLQTQRKLVYPHAHEDLPLTSGVAAEAKGPPHPPPYAFPTAKARKAGQPSPGTAVPDEGT